MLCQPCCGCGAGVDVDVDLVALVRGGDEHVLPAVVAADDRGGSVAGVEHLGGGLYTFPQVVLN